MKFTRSMRSREYGALFVPVSIEAEVYTFDLDDCVCEIVFDPIVFDTYPQVRITYEGNICWAWNIPRRATKQLKYKPYEMQW